jgi:septation ring formation regulator EzrA
MASGNGINGLAGSYAQSIEAHEDRLQRVESTLQDVVLKVGVVNTKQDYMAEAIDKGFEGLKGDAQNIIAKVDSHGKRLDEVEHRLKPLEADLGEEVQAKTDRNRTVRQVLLGFLMAAVGAGGTQLVSWFFAR